MFAYDHEGWIALDSQVAELGDMWLALMKDFRVIITAKDFTVVGQGKEPDKVYGYTVTESQTTGDGTIQQLDIKFKGRDGQATATSTAGEHFPL